MRRLSPSWEVGAVGLGGGLDGGVGLGGGFPAQCSGVVPHQPHCEQQRPPAQTPSPTFPPPHVAADMMPALAETRKTATAEENFIVCNES